MEASLEREHSACLENFSRVINTVATSGLHARGQGPFAKLQWINRVLAKAERGIAVLRDGECLAALEMKVDLMRKNEALERQMAEAQAAHAARDATLERRLAEAEAALKQFQLAQAAEAKAAADAAAEAEWARVASSPEMAVALAQAAQASQEGAAGAQASQEGAAGAGATTDEEMQDSTGGAESETEAEAEFAPAPAPDAAAAAAPAASAPVGSTGGATTHPRDDEATSPNKNPLKTAKKGVVQHSDSDTTAQQLTFSDEAAAAAPAAAAAAE